jgi:hypothetical protein
MRTFRFLIPILALAGCAVVFWRFAGSPDQAQPSNVLTQVRELSQLTTVRYTVQRIVTLTEEKHPVGSESILLIPQPMTS